MRVNTWTMMDDDGPVALRDGGSSGTRSLGPVDQLERQQADDDKAGKMDSKCCSACTRSVKWNCLSSAAQARWVAAAESRDQRHLISAQSAAHIKLKDASPQSKSQRRTNVDWASVCARLGWQSSSLPGRLIHQAALGGSAADAAGWLRLLVTNAPQSRLFSCCYQRT